ncbi:MAG: YwaF family protein [Clostridia bacterium]|nr:YwaF family protein [Clostridia bacterium]
MRELFFRLFSDTPFGAGVTIESFNIWHILYILIIFGGAISAAILMRSKDMSVKEKTLRILGYLLVISYVADFFVHDFVYADCVDGAYEAAGLNMDKLPFHICTVLCPIIAFVQFNKKFHRFIEPIAALAIVAPLMYLTYPSTGVGGEPWCYRTVQTMFFHGVEFAWGFLTVAFGKTKLEYKNVWKAAVVLVGIALWAKLGNTLLGYNWFFLESDPFGIGLPPIALLFLVPIAIFAMVNIIYGISYGVIAVMRKRGWLNKEQQQTQEEAEQ